MLFEVFGEKEEGGNLEIPGIVKMRRQRPQAKTSIGAQRKFLGLAIIGLSELRQIANIEASSTWNYCNSKWLLATARTPPFGCHPSTSSPITTLYERHIIGPRKCGRLPGQRCFKCAGVDELDHFYCEIFSKIHILKQILWRLLSSNNFKRTLQIRLLTI